ncbi:MAG: glycosyltransferase family 1 protein [Bacteroidales bacterium]|nr:glycosyltransferase family 1 protein [Bacteroidales bacterium]
MSSQYLHIISFNIPYPADYGGVIDVYYKLQALSQAGIRIILHCFQYGRKSSKELEDLCFKVYYYPRKKGIKYLLNSDPYIVITRKSNTMPKNLLGDAFPVLFEGLHTTGMLLLAIQARKKTLVRAHNIEHEYYRGLARSARNLYHKLFFLSESVKLKPYEKIVRHADHILSIAKHETRYFNKQYGNATFIPAFHRFEEVLSLPGRGTYILYHGNLGVAENSEMFLSLARESLAGLPYPVVVAGKNPSRRFRRRLSRYKNIRLHADPGDQELDSLIARAQINLLFTSQATGIKLKLLHALFMGRHCLVNPETVEGSGLEKLCTVATSDHELELQLHDLMIQPFDEEQIREREKALKEFSNRAGAEKILRLLS